MVDVKAAVAAVVRRVRENTVMEYDDQIAELEAEIARLRVRRATAAKKVHRV